jgi:two-component system, OmpR family, phosphate regulon sensor histidine kinase PhoR
MTRALLLAIAAALGAAGLALVSDNPLVVIAAAFAGAVFGQAFRLSGTPSEKAASPQIVNADTTRIGADLVVDAIGDAAFVLDQDLHVLALNASAAAFAGRSGDTAIGMRFGALIRDPEILAAARLAAGGEAPEPVLFVRAGVSVDEELRATALPLAAGMPRGAVVVLSDQSRASVVERQRAEFLANASHELRTPLAAVSLSLETITGAARDDAAMRERIIGLMKLQLDRMRQLIDDLLSLSRIERDERIPPTDITDLVGLCQEVADALFPIAEKRKVSIAIKTTSAAVMVRGDRFQLMQVVQNLADNAMRYAPAGSMISLEVGLSPHAETMMAGERRWPESIRLALLSPLEPAAVWGWVRVSDTGKGIAQRHLARLTERFFRIEREESGDRSGTGLGLAIVKHIVSRHRGGLMVETIEGRGTTFSLWLALAANS